MGISKIIPVFLLSLGNFYEKRNKENKENRKEV
jgi:hypothetical protein